MPSVEQDRRLSIRRRQLKPPGRGLVSRFHFGDHTSERPIAKPVFGKRKNIGVLATLGIENFCWAQPDLLKARRIEIEAGERPKDREARLCGKTRGDAGCEQGRRGIVIQARAVGGNLMKTGTVQPAVCKTVIERRDAERQSRAAPFAHAIELGAKRNELFESRPIERQSCGGHQSTSTHLFTLCSDDAGDSSSAVTASSVRRRSVALSRAPADRPALA